MLFQTDSDLKLDGQNSYEVTNMLTIILCLDETVDVKQESSSGNNEM